MLLVALARAPASVGTLLLLVCLMGCAVLLARLLFWRPPVS
ncbi:MAG TPA: hypothetical protein VHZ99_05825 [Steroidobacteraceae bacterium]|nr:hypothetical protein [Steroidobacteraceae bacterium]